MSEARQRVETRSYDLVRPSLDELLARGEPYTAYTYSYPHKTAYRPLASPRPLGELWRDEPREALFLYVHVPFCESRCGYCNLFSHACHGDALSTAYLAALTRQVRAVRANVDGARFARVAIGGGTPTSLAPGLLAQLLDLAEVELGASLAELPVSFETSPATASAEQLALIAGRGIDRLSIGVQSFDDRELHALGRSQGSTAARAALDRIRRHAFQTLNVDLIYGVVGQTPTSWLATLETALTWQPEELYLYPLYVRPLTGLGRAGRDWQDQRLELYRVGRDALIATGYEQISMRMFRRANAPTTNGPIYRCQEDGMIGLGCGARSYTRGLHYSDEWAVGASGVRGILERWVSRDADDFARAEYGYELDAEDQRARYVLKSLFQRDGFDLGEYRAYFGSDALDDRPELGELETRQLIERHGDRLLPTPRGLELSDCLGPWLYTDRVRARMGSFDLR